MTVPELLLLRLSPFRRREGLERNAGGVSRWTADCCSSRNDYGIVFLQAGAKNILIFFGLNDGPALETAATAFRIYALSVALAGVNVVTTSFWQTIGKTRYASGYLFYATLFSCWRLDFF